MARESRDFPLCDDARPDPANVFRHDFRGADDYDARALPLLLVVTKGGRRRAFCRSHARHGVADFGAGPGTEIGTNIPFMNMIVGHDGLDWKALTLLEVFYTICSSEAPRGQVHGKTAPRAA